MKKKWLDYLDSKNKQSEKVEKDSNKIKLKKNAKIQMRRRMRDRTPKQVQELLKFLQQADERDKALLFFNPKFHEDVKALRQELKSYIETFEKYENEVSELTNSLKEFGVPYDLAKLYFSIPKRSHRTNWKILVEVNKLEKRIDELWKMPKSPENVTELRKAEMERIHKSSEYSEYFKGKLCARFIAFYKSKGVNVPKKLARRLVENQLCKIQDSSDRYPTLAHQILPRET